MSVTKYKCPAPPANGSGTFSNELVGLQLVSGGGLTQGNFQFTTAIYEKIDRTFDTGLFSDPYTLENLNIESVEQAKEIVRKNFKVYPNFDLAQVTNYTLYGSLQKRLSSSITKIINFFPAGIQIDFQNYSLNTGYTAFNIIYDPIGDETSFDVDVQFFKNPFAIDYSVNAAQNIQVLPYNVSKYRDLKKFYESYSLYTTTFNDEYPIIDLVATTTLTAGTIPIVVKGQPFTGSQITDTIIIKPNNLVTEQVFKNDFDEIEQYLLNRNTFPKYTAKFQYPDYDSNGNYTLFTKPVTWKLDGAWNLDIETTNFDTYLTTIQEIAELIDQFKTNLLSRFLTSDSLKEFDTPDQKLEKVLQIYGRSFDETKTLIDALANMNSVNYITKNDIPDQLLSYIVETLGWKTNISPITTDGLNDTIYNTTNNVIYPGQSKIQTPEQVNIQYYKNLILNSAYLYKTKGTRKSIEYIMKMVGVPDQLIEFNEYVYLADQKISVSDFETQFAQISGGTKLDKITSLNSSIQYSIQSINFTGFVANSVITTVNTGLGDYPISLETGYPESAVETEDYFFQKGAGWFETTPEHTSPEVINFSTSEINPQIAVFSSVLTPFTYGQEYLDRYEKFPFLDLGYRLTRTVDNTKSWVDTQVGLRKNTQNYSETYYTVPNEDLAINSKNMELYLNMGQGITYDIWDMSSKYGYPIANTGLTSPYATQGGIDWTVINPKPNQKTFLEFAQTFYNNMINVRNRQWIFDGKTGGYPTLQYIFWKYLETTQNTNFPFNDFTYQKMVDYTLNLGDYWVRLVEQFVPATTLWNTGQKFDNSIFHRQKVSWKRQRGCTFVGTGSFTPQDEPPVQSVYEGGSGAYDCNEQTLTAALTMFDPFEILSIETNNAILNQGIDLSECNNNTVISTWYVEVVLTNLLTGNEQILLFEQFWIGDGPEALNQQTGDPLYYDGVLLAITNSLQPLESVGLGYSFEGGNLTIFNTTCLDEFTNSSLTINVVLDVTVECIN